MPAPFASNTWLCPAHLISWLQNVIFSQIVYNCWSFYLCGYLDIEYLFKFAELKRQVYIASEL